MKAGRRLVVELENGERRGIPISPEMLSLAHELATHGLPLNTRCGQR
jgi:hypothetical protein